MCTAQKEIIFYCCEFCDIVAAAVAVAIAAVAVIVIVVPYTFAKETLSHAQTKKRVNKEKSLTQEVNLIHVYV